MGWLNPSELTGNSQKRHKLDESEREDIYQTNAFSINKKYAEINTEMRRSLPAPAHLISAKCQW